MSNIEDRYAEEDLTKLPPGARAWDMPEDDGTMWGNVEALREAVVGRRIVRAEKGQREVQHPWRDDRTTRMEGFVITLDDGREVMLLDTDDCCAFTALGSFLLDPEMVDHIILGVGTEGGYSTWHIYADMGDVLALDVGWSSGNPFYYGYGFDIRVLGTVKGEDVA